MPTSMGVCADRRPAPGRPPRWRLSRCRPSRSARGLRTSFVHTSPDEADDTDAVRAQQRAPLRQRTGHRHRSSSCSTPSTTAARNKIGVLDAVARFEMSPKFNIWMGRFLPPSDRANLYGPYYSHHWAVYTDGIQNGYPFVFQGRDNGVAYWGDFGKVKVSVGVFDGAAGNGNPEVLTARRASRSISGTRKRLLPERHLLRRQEPAGLGGAIQVQAGDTATTVDFLLEKKARRRRRRHHDRERVRELRRARRLRRALRRERGRVRARQLPVSASRSASASSRSSASTPRRSSPRAALARLRPEHHRVQLQLRHQGVQRARDVLLQEHQLQRRARPISGRPASACRSRCNPMSQLHEQGANS